MILTKLGTILEMKKGKKPLHQLTEYTEGYLPYVDIKAFETGNINSYADGERCLSCEDGDILLVCDGSRSGLVGKAIKGYVGSTLAKISAKGVINDYLFYFLQGKYTALNTRKKGTGTPHVNPDVLMNAELFVPSVAEQQRIVAKIEELFSNLDASVAELKTAKEKLKIYRQAVITTAFPTLCEKNHVCLSEIAEITGGITKGRNLDGSDVIELPYLRVANVQNGYLDLEQVKMIELRDSEKNKYLLKYGDVLYTEGGDRDKLGRGTVWREEIADCVHQNHIFRARLNSEKAVSEYIAFWSMSKPARNYFYNKGKQSVNLASINKSVLSALPIPLPSLEQQKNIVTLIEEKISIADNIETTIDTALQQAEALRQSILKQAFEGKLI